MGEVTKSKKFLYGWLIVAGCMLIQGIPFTIAANLQPQFMDYVVRGEGFTISSFSLLFTIGSLAAAVASPIIGQLYSKINVKLIFIVGAVLSGGGFFLFGFADRLWQFYLIAIISQIGTAAISSIGVPLIINSWFSEEVKGKALGLAFAGGSIGNMFLQQLVVMSLTKYGYRTSYLFYGIISLLVGLLVAIFILRMPKNKNEIIKKVSKNSVGKPVEEESITMAELKSNKLFWLYAVGFIFFGLYVSAVAVQYPAYLKSFVGVKPTTVGLVGSTIALFALCGNLLGGALFDKFGVVKCMAVAFIFALASCVFLILSASSSNLAFAFAACIGLSIFSYILGPAYITGALFGKKNYGTILGIVNLMFAVGFSTGSSIFGLMIDKLGYKTSWFMVFIVIIIAYGTVITSVRAMLKNKKVNKEKKIA